MIAELKELWKFRELLFSVVERDLRIRYKNSFLGFFWSLLNPLITVLVMTVVFKYLIGNRTPNFSAYVLSAYLPYMFLQFALLDSSQSVRAALPIIKKVYFPKEILPLSAVISNFVHFLMALVVFFLYLLGIWLIYPGHPPFTWTALFLPVLILINLALAAGLALIVSALNTFYEDVKYIVAVVMYLLLFLSPIMYFSENVRYSKYLQGTNGEWIYQLYHLNPVAMLSTAYRKVLLKPQAVEIDGVLQPPLPLDWGMLGITALISFAVLIAGYAFFNKLKWSFVERP